MFIQLWFNNDSVFIPARLKKERKKDRKKERKLRMPQKGVQTVLWSFSFITDLIIKVWNTKTYMPLLFLYMALLFYFCRDLCFIYFQPVAQYLGYTHTFELLPDVAIHWPNDFGPPPNRPPCGYVGELCRSFCKYRCVSECASPSFSCVAMIFKCLERMYMHLYMH